MFYKLRSITESATYKFVPSDRVRILSIKRFTHAWLLALTADMINTRRLSRRFGDGAMDIDQRNYLARRVAEKRWFRFTIPRRRPSMLHCFDCDVASPADCTTNGFSKRRRRRRHGVTNDGACARVLFVVGALTSRANFPSTSAPRRHDAAGAKHAETRARRKRGICHQRSARVHLWPGRVRAASSVFSIRPKSNRDFVDLKG